MPPLRPTSNRDALLPTRVGLEAEACDITTQELAHYLRSALPAHPVPVSQEELDYFEGDVQHLADTQGEVWKAKYDNSCDAEMNTPPLRTFGQLQRARDVVANLRNVRLPARTPYEGVRVPRFDASTGMHLHVDLSPLSPAQAVHWFALLHRHQPFIYRAFHVAQTRLRFCAPMSSQAVGALIDAPPATHHEIAAAFGLRSIDRDVFANAQNLKRGGTGTGELRCFNGTADAGIIALAASVGIRAYQVAAASDGVTPNVWRDSIDDPQAFAFDFRLHPQHILLRKLMMHATRPSTYHEQIVNDPSCFKDLPLAVRDDLTLSGLAVSLDGLNLEHVGPNAAVNPHIVWTACVQNKRAIILARPVFRAHRPFVLELVGEAPLILPYVDDALRNDFGVVWRAFAEGSPRILEEAGPLIRSNLQAMQAFVDAFPDAIEFAQLPFDQCLWLAQHALRRELPSVRRLPSPWALDTQFLTALLRCVPDVREHLSAAQCQMAGLLYEGAQPSLTPQPM